MLVIARDGNLGDAICSISALDALRQKHPDLQILFRNEAVAALLPKNLRERCTWDIPNGQHDILTLGAWEAVQRYGRNEHATQVLMRLAGVEPPKDIPRPRIVFEDKAPAYDYVIAPFTADQRERGWDLNNFDLLVDAIYEQIDDNASVAFVGGPKDNMEPLFPEQCYQGKSLAYVASLMKNARKAVITLDSGPSRLAHAVGCKRHILLASNVTPLVWQTHPGCHALYADPHGWSVQQVLNAVKSVAV